MEKVIEFNKFFETSLFNNFSPNFIIVVYSQIELFNVYLITRLYPS